MASVGLPSQTSWQSQQGNQEFLVMRKSSGASESAEQRSVSCHAETSGSLRGRTWQHMSSSCSTQCWRALSSRSSGALLFGCASTEFVRTCNGFWLRASPVRWCNSSISCTAHLMSHPTGCRDCCPTAPKIPAKQRCASEVHLHQCLGKSGACQQQIPIGQSNSRPRLYHKGTTGGWAGVR